MPNDNPLGGHPRQLAILGYPVAHSISPAMHNEAFRHQRMNCRYGAFAVEPAGLEAAVEGLRTLGFLGANVTIPHKEAVIGLLDEVAPTARQIGAVNTIVNRGGRLIGYNTDGWGFVRSLEEAGVRPRGLTAVVLGAGGAARAISVYLLMAGALRLIVSNRTGSRAEALAREVALAVPDAKVEAVEALSAKEHDAFLGAGLVVNCTPLGMHPDIETTPISDISLLPQQAVVYDTVYTPADTRMLRDARARRLRTVGGLGMLVHQGACAWEYWFGRRGPVSVMHRAAQAALEGNL